MANNLPYDVKTEKDLSSPTYDGIILVSSLSPDSSQYHESFREPLQRLAAIDNAVTKVGGVAEILLPARRLVYAPTGPLNADYDDARAYGEAAAKGIKRAVEAGVKNGLLVIPHPEKNIQLVALLGALQALYVPLQVREDIPEKCPKMNVLGVYGKNIDNIVSLALMLESGRWVARDIGGGDPERMAPPNIEKYVNEIFNESDIEVEVISKESELKTEYPLFAAVNRAASVIERHKGRVIYLTYNPKDEVKKTLMLVGKGITYDTGGADIKAGGVMAGMSRDKCGAAAVAGLMQVLAFLKPKHTKVIGALCLARNSVGENCYVSDEVITARSKKRVRVGNTDAEGRMAMADVLCRMKEAALNEINPHLFTLATLTGHAVLTSGVGYSIVMDNGPARKLQNAQTIQAKAEPVGDMIEISTIRREDFLFHKGKCEGDDLLQANNSPSVRTPRGHQGPAAFIIQAAGLDKHGLDSSKPIPYSHLDIGGAAGDYPDEPTGSPIVALTMTYLVDALP